MANEGAPSNAPSNAAPVGKPLQLVKLNNLGGNNPSVEVGEDALAQVSSRLKERGAQRLAIVSVMGAFRTGKSFLLDLFLRYLRYEEMVDAGGVERKDDQKPPERGTDADYPLPDWVTWAGQNIEGSDDNSSGFRFKGGMDICTEGIWVWSEPFIRTVEGQKVALLLFDTQGAWDSSMTKEQSATIFGLTAVLSSMQIYNISMQIQEDKVDNLTYFMQFAQSAISQAAQEMNSQGGTQIPEEQVNKPFQQLDFLVRDWRNFKKNWTMDECKAQMGEHLSRHVDPAKVRESSTAQVLTAMFHKIGCFCLPHPGLIIEEDTWGGNVTDISKDFVRFADVYVREVFSRGLKVKEILGSELTPISFPLVLKEFISAFRDAAPAAMTFTQAITQSTVFLAKEKAMKKYTSLMDKAMEKSPGGQDQVEFEKLHRELSATVQEEYQRVTIFGSETVRKETWQSIQESLQKVFQKYSEDNDRRLERALVGFAHVTLWGVVFFILDRISDFTCDWWSDTCTQVSKLALMIYTGIFLYVGTRSYFFYSQKGLQAALLAAGELWKEMVRLMNVYSMVAKDTKLSDVIAVLQKVTGGKGKLD